MKNLITTFRAAAFSISTLSIRTTLAVSAALLVASPAVASVAASGSASGPSSGPSSGSAFNQAPSRLSSDCELAIHQLVQTCLVVEKTNGTSGQAGVARARSRPGCERLIQVSESGAGFVQLGDLRLDFVTSVAQGLDYDENQIVFLQAGVPVAVYNLIKDDVENELALLANLF